MRKILVLDDNNINLIILNKLFSNNFIIKTLSDSTLAFDFYKDFKPDILITDLDMTELNGLELLKTIRDIDKNIKIIVLTYHYETEYLIHAVELNLTKYLIKPVRYEVLNNAIINAIEDLNNYEVVRKKILKISEELYWDYETFSLFYKNDQIKLMKKEFKLMKYLTKNPNQVKFYEELFQNIWEDKYYTEDSKGPLKTLIYEFKNKLSYNMIINVSGIGYRLNIIN